MKILLSVLAIIFVLGGTVVGSYVSNANYGNEMEQSIDAQYKEEQNIRSNYFKKVTEVVQVNSMYKDHFKELIDAAIEGRYGAEGSKAALQFITEQNPTLDASLYTKVQQIIESGRNEFKNSQSVLIDMIRSYKTNLGYVWKGFWLKLAGYPKIKFDDYKLITDSNTNEVFKTGEETPIEIYKK